MLQQVEQFTAALSHWAWGYHLLILLVGGGVVLLFYSRFVPFRYLKHTFQILSGKYDDDSKSNPGDLNHFQTLCSSIASTVGMGNISGVAIAISVGGPGALFWMWLAAVAGMAIKFFDCSLAIMYRGKDSLGRVQGGPMYTITEGLGKKWKPLAQFFCVAAVIGVLPLFTSNQLTQIIRDVLLIPYHLTDENQHFLSDALTGLLLMAVVSLVIFGGIQRIADAATKLVPAMILFYMISISFIVLTHLSKIPHVIHLIFTDAFQGAFYQGDFKSLWGGALGAMIITGVKRSAFSHESGIGTAPLAHGAVKTEEPIREGMVAMIGPAIDTLLVCSLTAFAILITDSWQLKNTTGIAITLDAFHKTFGNLGDILLLLSAIIFAITTLFTNAYFGSKCLGFLIGAKYQDYYEYLYIASIFVAAIISLNTVINLVDSMFALMAIPNMIATLLLAPKVKAAMKDYFNRYLVEEEQQPLQEISENV